MTTALITVESALLVVLIVLVAGLLRSHAEVLRRLGPGGDGSPLPAPPPGQRARATAPALTGSTLAGDAVRLSFESGGSTLLAFLTTSCSSCAGFWETLGEPRLPPGVETVIVTRAADRESPSKLRKLAPPGVPVVMSSEAWALYAVPGSPYFVLVDGVVRGEGVATTWEALASLVTDAVEDEQLAGGGEARARGIDETLAAAGIGPGHHSLYPGSRS